MKDFTSHTNILHQSRKKIQPTGGAGTQMRRIPRGDRSRVYAAGVPLVGQFHDRRYRKWSYLADSCAHNVKKRDI